MDASDLRIVWGLCFGDSFGEVLYMLLSSFKLKLNGIALTISDCASVKLVCFCGVVIAVFDEVFLEAATGDRFIGDAGVLLTVVAIWSSTTPFFAGIADFLGLGMYGRTGDTHLCGVTSAGFLLLTLARVAGLLLCSVAVGVLNVDVFGPLRGDGDAIRDAFFGDGRVFAGGCVWLTVIHSSSSFDCVELSSFVSGTGSSSSILRGAGCFLDWIPPNGEMSPILLSLD